MIEKIISWSVHNRLLVWLLAGVLFIAGIWSVITTPVDAIPDLSENQVIVYTEWMGRNPQIMEDQITYPLVSNMQGIPGVKSVRANSMFGMSFVFVIFHDDTDIYWARTRVLEKLNYAQRFLPEGVIPTLGPDGTGVGHIFWYVLDAPGYDLGEQRAIQDWYVKLALQNIEGVSEVASYGGFQKQYQVVVDPHQLAARNISYMSLITALRENNRDVGGGTFEIGSTGLMVRGIGYVEDISDIRNISVSNRNGVPIRIGEIATVQEAGEYRVGITEENGNGEVVGGIVVMRYNENPEEVIERVKERMKEVSKGLPPGVSFRVVYDRSNLIDAAIATLEETLWEELIIVSLVILLFIFHVRSALVVILTIPLSVLIGFIFIKISGISLNIMSLGGIALAVGDLVDAGIVMVENTYQQLTRLVVPEEK